MPANRLNPLTVCNGCDADQAVTDAGYCADCDPVGAEIVVEPTLQDVIVDLNATIARLSKYVTS